jgi:NAD(P)H dehydrogenase (quinone)
LDVRRFDYDAPAELACAIAGVERLLLISSDNVAHRVGQHRAVIDAVAHMSVRKLFSSAQFELTSDIASTASAVRNPCWKARIVRGGADG